MTYQETIDAINNAPPNSPLYGARLTWALPKYIGKGTSGMLVYGESASPAPYIPTSDDQQATNWIKGGDRPPAR